MKILAIGAHPDDIETACFGTLLKYKNKGYKIYNLVISLGEDAGDPIRRKKESEEAAKLLDAEIKFGNLQSALLSNNSGRETIELIEGAIKSLKPDIVFTHTIHDRHQDHRLVNQATESACRLFSGDLYYYEGVSSLKTFVPNVFSAIDDLFEEKMGALKIFFTQSGKPYMSREVIESRARFRACQANMWNSLAEAFEIGREII